MLTRVACALVLTAVLGLVASRTGHFIAVREAVGNVRSPVGDCRCPGQYLVDSTNCSAFYECDQDHNPLAFGCPHNLQFNQVKQVCDFKTNVDCDVDGHRPALSLPDPCQPNP